MTHSATCRLNIGNIARKPQILLLVIAISFSVFATNVPAAQITLAWDAAASSGIAGYRIHYGTSSGHYSASIDVGPDTSCTVPELTNGTTYYFAVTAYASDKDESSYSNEISYTVPADVPADEPAEVTLSSIAIGGPTQVDENGNAQFTCTAFYSDGSSTLLTSGVSWNENSTAATISSSALLTAGSVNADTAVTITAAYGGKTDTQIVTIKILPPTLTSISITGPIQVSENSSTQLTCTAFYSDGSSTVLSSGVSWSENASAATISSSGKLYAGTVTSDTEVSVTAACNGRTDTHSVTIKKTTAILASLSISGPSRLDEQSSGQFSCTARYSDNSTSTVTDSVEWSVNSGLAAIDDAGRLTTRAVQGEEHVTITAAVYGKQASSDLIITDSTTSYSLNIDISGSGAVLLDPPGGIYDNGTVVTLTAEPDRAWAFDGWTGAVADTESSTTSVTMDSDIDLSAAFLEDTDMDSVPDQEEWGSNSQDLEFDGNADGIADYLQGSVASMHTGDYQYYFSLSAAEPGRITMCRTMDTDSIAEAPAGHILPLGLVAFRIEDIPQGAATALTIHLPAGMQLDTFYKYGPTPDNPSNHWYEFMYDQISETGAVIGGETITLYFKDGLRGDSDLSANGVISGPGGPAILGADPAPPGSQLSNNDPATSVPSGGSNGCFIDTIVTSAH